MNSFIKKLMNSINKILYFLLKNIILFYQKIISPIMPARCRYYPTCSQYGQQALAWHGVWAGGWLLLKRLGRCHPLGGHGIDFVPLPLASYIYHPLALSVYHSSVYVYRDKYSYAAQLNQLMKVA